MADQLSIENLALLRLGEEPIITVGDSSERALALAAIYDDMRDVVQSDYPWKFCTVRANLSPSGTPPIFGYRYQYPLPSDCLKFWGIVGAHSSGWPMSSSTWGEVDPRLRYDIEGQYVVTNVQVNGFLPVKYSIQITDESQFTPLFGSTFALRLAAEVAYRLTRNAALKGEILKEYFLELNKATSADAKQGTPNKALPERWQDARMTGNSGAGWPLPMGPPTLTPGDTFWLSPVLSKTATPPSIPNSGDRYLVDVGGTGAWAGQDGDIAEWVITYQVGSWQFNTPATGSAVFVRDTRTIQFFD